MKLYDFMTTPELAGAEFSGPSWATWRMVARLIDGDAHLLNAEERSLALQLTGRTTLPSVAPKEVFIGAGRRSGKSRFAALVSVWLSAREYPQLSAGETAVVAHVAPDRDQATIDLDYSRGIVDRSDLLRAELGQVTRDTLTFRHRTELQVVTASFRTSRGRTLCGAVIDESAFLRSEESALPDVELARALRPALLTLNGLMLVISSPHRKVGLLFDAHKRYFGNDDETRGLYIQASSRQLNPTLDQEAIDAAYADDAEAARSEHGGLFRSDVSEYIPDTLLEAAVVPGRLELPWMLPHRGWYMAFCDVSAGVHDAACLAIAHKDYRSEKVVLDLLHVLTPPFGAEEVVMRFAAVCQRFEIRHIVGDRYAQSWTEAAFRRSALRYEYSQLDKSAIYCETLALFSQKRVELLDDKRLLTELRLLERKPRAGGRGDSIDHPPRGHDDIANAACGALWQASLSKAMRATGPRIRPEYSLT